MAGVFGTAGNNTFSGSSNQSQLQLFSANAWSNSTGTSKNVFGGSDGDSAIGSSADPTPTHVPKAPPRYSGLDFHEDPFKDANHRYGDPFDIEGADPFVEDTFDPFTANVQDAFGTASTTSTLRKKEKPNKPTASDAFAAFDAWGGNNNNAGVTKTTSSDPWGASASKSAVPKSSANLDDSFDPFSLKNQLKQNKDSGFSNDPFSPSNFPPPSTASSTSSDPFSPAFSKAFTPNDPFSVVQSTSSPAKSNTASKKSTKVDFDAVFGPSNIGSTSTSSNFTPSSARHSTVAKPPPNKTLSLQKSETIANVPKLSTTHNETTSSNLPKSKKSVTQSLSRPWGAPYLETDGASSSSKPHKSHHSSKFAHLGDLLTGSPSKSGGGHSDTNAMSKESSATKEKKKKSSYLSPFRPKKQHSFSAVDKSKSAVDLSHMGVTTAASAPPQPGVNHQMEALHVRMASEASKRAEEDRMRRIQLQEEQDLAYAIALSKAEAVSVKQQ